MPLFCHLEKIVNNSKGYVPTVLMIMSFNNLKYFSYTKIIPFCLLAYGKVTSNWKNWKHGRLGRKRLQFPGKMLVFG